MRVLDEDRAVSEFTATATVAGGLSVEVFVDVVKFRERTAGRIDIIVAVAVYTQQLSGECRRVDALLRALEHPLKQTEEGSGRLGTSARRMRAPAERVASVAGTPVDTVHAPSGRSSFLRGPARAGTWTACASPAAR